MAETAAQMQKWCDQCRADCGTDLCHKCLTPMDIRKARAREAREAHEAMVNATAVAVLRDPEFLKPGTALSDVIREAIRRLEVAGEDPYYRQVDDAIRNRVTFGRCWGHGRTAKVGWWWPKREGLLDWFRCPRCGSRLQATAKALQCEFRRAKLATPVPHEVVFLDSYTDPHNAIVVKVDAANRQHASDLATKAMKKLGHDTRVWHYSPDIKRLSELSLDDALDQTNQL